jgi:hypothetical protein
VIVALAGLAGSGKSTAAEHLVGMGFVRHRFAGPIKNMLRALGLSEREIEGDLKEQPCELLGGKTPRWAMQSLGSEWGRFRIDPSLWKRAWIRTLPAGNVVAEDCRFANEAAAARQVGGKIILIERPGLTPGEHVSEKLPFAPDVVIRNDGTVADFLARIGEAVNGD